MPSCTPGTGPFRFSFFNWFIPTRTPNYLCLILLEARGWSGHIFATASPLLDAIIYSPWTASLNCSPHAIPLPEPHGNPILVQLPSRSRVPNGRRSGRDQGRGVDHLKWRCGLLSTPVQPFELYQTQNTILVIRLWTVLKSCSLYHRL